MKKWFKNNKLYLIGAAIGAIAGYLYWQQIGCASGTCMITSKPVNSTIYGAIMVLYCLVCLKRKAKNKL